MPRFITRLGLYSSRLIWMKWRGCARQINSTDPSVEPESITINSQFLYSCARSAGRVSRSAQPSLHDLIMMLTNGDSIESLSQRDIRLARGNHSLTFSALSRGI